MRVAAAHATKGIRSEHDETTDHRQRNRCTGFADRAYQHDKITALVRKNDGSNESQDADIEPGQQVHRFEFPTIDKSAVKEVLLSRSNGRCYVIGPGG